MILCGKRHVPTSLPPGKNPINHCTGGWTCPTVILKVCAEEETFPPQGFQVLDVQPVANRYAAYGIPAPSGGGGGSSSSSCCSSSSSSCCSCYCCDSCHSLKALLILKKETVISFTETGLM